MTKEEALLKIGELVAYARTQGWDDIYTDAFKTLEQEPSRDEEWHNRNVILDKIRAEIMAMGNWTTKGELPNGYLVKVLEIIDKYRAESEET